MRYKVETLPGYVVAIRFKAQNEADLPSTICGLCEALNPI